ncbi:MAG: O-methyltransferase [Anaerolineae bacterium]
MDIVDPRIDDYLTRTLAVEHPILQEMGEYGISRNFPIVGPQVGRLLNLLARSISARRVLELGSGYGYSAMWFALAVGNGGQVIMSEHSQENVDRARDYFARAGLLDRIVPNIGSALEIARQAAGPFDIVFCDMNKEDYPAALGIARDKLRVGGYFICDNLLRNGRVLTDRDPATQGVLELTRQLMQAQDFVTTIVPVRDGVSLSLRIS